MNIVAKYLAGTDGEKHMKYRIYIKDLKNPEKKPRKTRIVNSSESKIKNYARFINQQMVNDYRIKTGKWDAECPFVCEIVQEQTTIVKDMAYVYDGIGRFVAEFPLSAAVQMVQDNDWTYTPFKKEITL